MKAWMQQLIEHYQSTRKLYSRDRLLILFDIDGTILDLRHTVVEILKGYDRARGSSYFAALTIEDVTTREDALEDILRNCDVPPSELYEVTSWYLSRRWSSYTMLRASQPMPGVFEMISWFVKHPDTEVGLNTARPESLRIETLFALNKIASNFGFNFQADLLFMNKASWPLDVPQSKVEGVRHFQSLGMRVFAMVDNERENLLTIRKDRSMSDVLLILAQGPVIDRDNSSAPSNLWSTLQLAENDPDLFEANDM